MRVQSDKDQFTEVSIIGDEDAMFSMSNRKYLRVGKARREVDRDSRDVMTERSHMEAESGVGALIQQEPHAFVGNASAVLLRLPRFASTASRAYARAACTSSMRRRG